MPVDAVTASGSGLDPDISVQNALDQAPRVARARHLPASRVIALVHRYTQDRQWGFLGERAVNVLKLNLALDGIAQLGGRHECLWMGTAAVRRRGDRDRRPAARPLPGATFRGVGASPGDRVFLPVERLVYRVLGVDPESSWTWRAYALAVLAFGLASRCCSTASCGCRGCCR